MFILSLLGAALALFAAITTPAEAGKPNPTVTLDFVGPSTTTSAVGGCAWDFMATWDETQTTGPKIRYTFVELLSNGNTMVVGFGNGIPDVGERLVQAFNVSEGSHTYEFRLQKGPKHVVAAGAITMDCP